MTPLPLSSNAKRLATDMVMVLAVLGAGLLCTAAVFSNLREAQTLRIYEQRSALAETVVAALDHDATSTIEAIRGAALMAEMQPGMSAAQFEVYASRMKTTHPGLAAIQWQKQDGETGFIHPPALHTWVHSARPQIAEAQKDARVVGMPVATAPFPADLNPAEPAQAAVALSVPVYQRSSGSDSINRHIGFINALVDVSALTRNAAYQAQASGSDLLLIDESQSDKPVTLFSTLQHQEHVRGHDQESGHKAAMDYLMELSFGSRTWSILLHPSAHAAETPGMRQATLALLLGFVMTLLLTVLLVRSQSSRRRSEMARAHEQALRDELLAEQYRLQEVVESTGVAIWEYNLQQRFLSVGERWHVVSGYSREELGDNVLTSWMALVHPDDRDHISATFAGLAALQGDRFEYEYRMRQKDGAWMWVNSRAHVVERDADGTPTKVAGINLEVTRQKEAEMRIHALNASLEAQMQDALARSEARATLGTLIASVSHEMATPMGNSMMTASTLSAQAAQFEQQLEAGTLRRSELTQFVSQVRDGNALLLRNLERAVSLLKNFRQVAADQASEQRRRFDLQDCLREIMDTLTPSLRRQRHRVELDVPEGIAMDSYPGPLGQVLINLINNAYLHAFEGMEQGTVQVSASATDSRVTLVCADNGRGIAPETLEKMFQPFFSTRIGRGGTGLGMTIVENLVKTTLGGQLEVSSVLGQGTTITITLPLQAPEPRVDEL
ncbi:ATP-binding protein [Rhodoferax bucti]|uniref:ATP-binding protein n=1 Tax=Rhodoferax bucti TaxID=2576305 RepID=UPI001108FD97|nr:ATP-binding protein [Rhodoferax bucti]